MRRQQFRASQTAIRSPTALADPLTLVHSYDVSVNPTKPARSSPLGSSTIAGLPLELLERLKAFPLFQTAPDSFLLSIGRSLRPSIYQPAQEIIREGEDAKAMYWVVRGSVRVTSRDGESTYAELRPGSFFGEIGILMDMPRTASIVASVRSLVVRLNKEDLKKTLPKYPEVERAIREEALERLTILERKKKERGSVDGERGNTRLPLAPRKRSRDWVAGDVQMGEVGSLADGEVLASKKRKSPSPGLGDISFGSGMSNPPLTVRRLLKELPLFSGLPSEILHFLGVNAQAVTFLPFTDIIKQGTTGRDVYFIIKGDVEVLTESSAASKYLSPSGFNTNRDAPKRQRVRARLHAGQYFGEVTSLSLAPVRTATVRSVHSVECLLISGLVIDHLWERCGDDLRQQVENEAKRRLKDANRDDDVVMTDAGTDSSPAGISTAPMIDEDDENGDWRKALPVVKFDVKHHDEQSTPAPQMEPIDPDPYFNADLIHMRAKSRRSSLAPPLPPSANDQMAAANTQRTPSPPAIRLLPTSPLSSRQSSVAIPSSPVRASFSTPRRPSLVRLPSMAGRGRLPDPILVIIFQHLELLDLMRCRLISTHWWNLLNASPHILHHLDLSIYNKYLGDDNLKNIVAPFVGERPRYVDLSNCFHITDDGFRALADSCGTNVRIWKMKSVWDVSGPAVLALVDKAKNLEELDLSNCRKVGDNLLARVIGWVVPEKPALQQERPQQQFVAQIGRRGASKRNTIPAQPQRQNSDHPQPPPGTVIGASNLKRLTLSYCKHVQDRSMAHIAVHAASRLVSLDLTRCTSISDAGFHAWSSHDFTHLRKLILADCTYLSDQAIVGVVGGCRGLLELDLSFCCALSDTATEVLALGLPALRSLNMAFCGSAVSDNSMQRMGLHLLELRSLSVRGCVRVTGQGVESVVEGCRHLEALDVSQCKNLRAWLDRGGVPRVIAPVSRGGLGRRIRFDTIANGTWRVGPR